MSEGWLAGFKYKHGLVFKTVYGGRGEMDEEVVKDRQKIALHMAYGSLQPERRL